MYMRAFELYNCLKTDLKMQSHLSISDEINALILQLWSKILWKAFKPEEAHWCSWRTCSSVHLCLTTQSNHSVITWSTDFLRLNFRIVMVGSNVCRTKYSRLLFCSLPRVNWDTYTVAGRRRRLKTCDFTDAVWRHSLLKRYAGSLPVNKRFR